MLEIRQRMIPGLQQDLEIRLPEIQPAGLMLAQPKAAVLPVQIVE